MTGPTQKSSKYGIGPPQQEKMTKYTGPTQDLLTQKSSKYGTSWALTSSTMSSLQTSSTPSLEDSLRFLRSCKVPLFLNFLRSLYRDLLHLFVLHADICDISFFSIYVNPVDLENIELTSYLIVYSFNLQFANVAIWWQDASLGDQTGKT